MPLPSCVGTAVAPSRKRPTVWSLTDEAGREAPCAVGDFLMFDLARWLYLQLEAEYEHLTSDKAIEEGIIVNEFGFTEEGRRFG